MSETGLYELKPDEDIPTQVLEQIQDAVLPFSAMLASVQSRGDSEIPRFAGSSSLVEIAGRPYVLTAAHVWTEVLRLADKVGIHLGSRDVAVTFPCDLMTPTVIGQPPFERRLWGPDLAFLRLPERIRRVVEDSGSKAFYNMDRVRQRILADEPAPRPGAWVLVGCPERASAKTEGEPLDIRGFTLFGFTTDAREVGNHDFLDVTVRPPPDAGVPDSLRGVSGGGLWWAPITKNADTGEIAWDGTRRLEGVAFREEFEGQRIVRCHWRRSLYGVGLQTVATAHS